MYFNITLYPADGAGVALDVPGPHGNGVPLLEREHASRVALLRAALGGGARS